MKKRHPIIRFFRHLFSMPLQVKWCFSSQALKHIEQAIAKSEQSHAGEIRFVVEAGLHPLEILFKKSPRKRAIELFGRFNIWDTAQNNGVLIYLLLADRDVEIVADRGINQFVGNQGWDKICSDMEVLFRRGEFEAGVLQGIAEVGALLAQHFPIQKSDENELPNRPIIM